MQLKEKKIVTVAIFNLCLVFQVLFCRLTDEQKDIYQEYLDSKECNMILSGNFMVKSKNPQIVSFYNLHSDSTSRLATDLVTLQY